MCIIINENMTVLFFYIDREKLWFKTYHIIIYLYLSRIVYVVSDVYVSTLDPCLKIVNVIIVSECRICRTPTLTNLATHIHSNTHISVEFI